MRRLVVSTSCIMKDGDTARDHYQKLDDSDRRRMLSRCQKYGVALSADRLE